MLDVVIIHGIPISYQHILFSELANQGLLFKVLFVAARSCHRRDTPPLAEAVYRYQIGFDGVYESAPILRSVTFVLGSLESLNPAAVIICGWSDVAAWTGWIWALLRRRSRILWMESTEEDHSRVWWKEAIKSIFVKRCQFAHVYGTKSKQYLVKLGMPASRVAIGRALVNTGLFSPRGSTEVRSRAERVVLFVGRFAVEKNLPTLLHAVQLCLARGGKGRLRLALVGYGPQEQELRELVTQFDIADSVEFWGPATQEALPGLYRSADAFVLPSMSETWGLVVNEAMLCGLPVIVSDRCGCALDLVTTATGWTFSPFDTERLAALLFNLVDLPEPELRAMGRAARELAMTSCPSECARAVIATLKPRSDLNDGVECTNEPGY